jgi:predicted Zn-dependent protease with MMP-like domain
VEDWPDAETLQDLGIDDPLDLLGLYQGNPLTERSLEWGGGLPDRIVLYQRPIEHWARADGAAVAEVIRETLVHEIGHHLGLDEEDLQRLEAGDREEPEVP